jgi:ankyrin repeat protein
MVDFIIQNSSSLDRRTREGNTPLHYCVIQNQPEAMRLLLRSGASPDLANNNGKTPLSIAKERGYHLCEELVRATDIFALFFRKNKCNQVPKLTASSYMVKYLRISSYIRKTFLIYDFATDPI